MNGTTCAWEGRSNGKSGPAPGRIDRKIDVDLVRPRDRTSDLFLWLPSWILEHLHPQNVLAVVAEFEQSVIMERINAGLAAALERGKKLGRPRTLDRHINAVVKLQRLLHGLGAMHDAQVTCRFPLGAVAPEQKIRK